MAKGERHSAAPGDGSERRTDLRARRRRRIGRPKTDNGRGPLTQPVVEKGKKPYRRPPLADRSW